MNLPYIPGREPPPDLPLGRFLPPIPAGMVSTWCKANLSPGTMALEPFGFNPLIPIELVTAGFPVLVTANNPIHAFLIRILASAPAEEELVAALQDLATASKGEDRMEPYIRSLYQVQCADCGTLIEADAFLWKKEEEQPYAAIVECPSCGAKGEQTLDKKALATLTDLPPARLHQARALNRIASQDDPLRAQVQHALNTYPTRPLIILQTIINKLDSIEQSPRRRDLLIALILSAADQGNTLWAYPSPRERPRQLVIPPVFQEDNLWKSMEKAITAWQVLQEPLPLVEWDGTLPSTPAILLFQGRLKELTPTPKPSDIGAVVAAVPRPNQAFWTLSALWTGWIWGQEAVAPIRQALSRQRYDWNWHARALHLTFSNVQRLISPDCKIWGLVAENEPMLLLSTLLAADTAGYRLSGFSQFKDDELAQCRFDVQTEIATSVEPADCLKLARESVRDYLISKGEPAPFQLVHAAAITNLAARNMLAVDIFLENENQITSETEKLLENLFKEHGFLTRVGGGTASLETGDWWLTNQKEDHPPLIDRLEKLIVKHVIHEKSTNAEKLQTVIFPAFPGLYTPTQEEVLNCLESYAIPQDSDRPSWVLRDSDTVAARKTDIRHIRECVTRIGKRLGYQVKGEDPLIWYERNENGPAAITFHIVASAIVQKHLQEQHLPATTRILLIPGSRANLLAYKEQRDPVLKAALDREFIVVKFRLIRDLDANPLLTRELFLEQIRVDPPEYQASQLALL
jgi:hypothetical protein